MGGDYAPEAAVKGAVMALDAIGPDSRIVLFGDEAKVKAVLAAEGCPAERFDIVATTEVIEMGDHPAKAFQAKADSSITVGFGYLAKGAIDGFASAGSTGAMMVGSMYAVKPIEGVIRPTISSIIPTVTGHPALLLDVGLNVDWQTRSAGAVRVDRLDLCRSRTRDPETPCSRAQHRRGGD